MKFPGDSKHTAVVLEDWAKEFNQIRGKNKNLQKDDLIPSGTKDEVCQTFEKYPGVFNKYAPVKGGDIQASISQKGLMSCEDGVLFNFLFDKQIHSSSTPYPL